MVLQNRMAGHANVPARNEDAQEELAPIAEVIAQSLFLLLAKNRKARQRVPMAAADFLRKPPHPAASGPQLDQFLLGELQKAVRRIGAYGMHRIGGAFPQPFKAIGLFDMIQSPLEYQRKRAPVFRL